MSVCKIPWFVGKKVSFYGIVQNQTNKMLSINKSLINFYNLFQRYLTFVVITLRYILNYYLLLFCYDYFIFMLLPPSISNPSFLGGFCHEDSFDLGQEYEMSTASKYATSKMSKSGLIYKDFFNFRALFFKSTYF